MAELWQRATQQLANWQSFTKAERFQYRADTKALICRDLPKPDSQQLQQGLRIEDGVFWLSRLYVPFSFYRLYSRGLLEESFSFGEVRHVVRILLVMHLVDLGGHFLMRMHTGPVVDKHTKMNQDAIWDAQQSQMKDYLEQKKYFNDKKQSKL